MRSLRSRLRLILATGAVVGAVVLCVPAVLGFSGVIGWTEAVTLTLLGLLCAAVGALGASVLLLSRRMGALSRSVTTAMDAHSRRIAETLGQDRLENVRVLEGVHERFVHLQEHTLPRMNREIRNAVTVQGRNDYEQQVAWTELREHLDTATFMPPLRGWAASPDVLRVLVRHIDRLRPELVVECGSGASSVWIGYALRRAGGGRLVAFEHDARYAELSRELVAAHGLDDVVEVRHAPLVETASTTVTVDGQRLSTADRWYDTSAFADLEGVGLVFVDGPPKATGLQARYPAVPVLLPRCTEDVVIVLDDAARDDERGLGDRWLDEYPELHRVEEAAEKGAHVFSRKGA
ncbi:MULTISPECIES: class I SAM-dependent methyltransferase [Nocardiopsis]|jgi:predicted O-methyltransferase YrrM|uniref:Methyltransferase n=1 Tax=Nocardiopsis sinuspersici TaxID=501010 RepID=A0A1V3BWE7_9ACTN|nr:MULTISPECIES: class I SAM-dependent methyltransferase [Nocardiopsis]NYH54078.1 putative O-methyltransferase YrrM [Nocardiopsis sinuspersici]OOC52917.1 methyltransferase [Nocardiopsis sinuspersici]